jgi:hypothetical protein
MAITTTKTDIVDALLAGGNWSPPHTGRMTSAAPDLTSKAPELLLPILNIIGCRPRLIQSHTSEAGALFKVFSEQSYVVKVFCRNGDAEACAYFQRKLNEHLIKQPEMLLFDASRKTVPWDFAVFEYINHVNLHNCSKSILLNAAIQLGDVLLSLHSIPTPSYGSPGRGKWIPQSWASVLEIN